MIKKRVFTYGFTLILSRVISFLLTLFIIRTLPINDMGIYYYLIGIATVLELIMSWGSPVSIQKYGGKIDNSNLAFTALLLAFLIGMTLSLFISLSPLLNNIDNDINYIGLIFLFSTAFSGASTGILVAFYRSTLSAKNDIYFILSRECLKLGGLISLQFFFELTMQYVLTTLITINYIIITTSFIITYSKLDRNKLRFNTEIKKLLFEGIFLMLTFLVYTFPIILIRIIGFIKLGEEASALLNICLVSSAGFQLYTTSWAMAIKPIISRLNNNNEIETIAQLWREIYLLYILGCVTLYAFAILFYEPIINLFKLNTSSVVTRNVYFIIVFYNLIYSLGAINNSFLQMMSLTKTELKAMIVNILLCSFLIYFCYDSSIEMIAWSVVLLELTKLIVQELVFYFKSTIRIPTKTILETIIVLTMGCLTIALTT